MKNVNIEKYIKGIEGELIPYGENKTYVDISIYFDTNLFKELQIETIVNMGEYIKNELGTFYIDIGTDNSWFWAITPITIEENSDLESFEITDFKLADSESNYIKTNVELVDQIKILLKPRIEKEIKRILKKECLT